MQVPVRVQEQGSAGRGGSVAARVPPGQRWLARLRRLLRRLWLPALFAGVAIWANLDPGNLNALLLVLGFVGRILFAVLFVVVQFGTIFWFVSRTRTVIIRPEDPKSVTFGDYWGQPALLSLVKQWISLLSDRDKFVKMGGQYINGLLLYGEPGTGKTLLAKAMAGEAGVAFVSVEGSAFRGMFWGMDTLRMMQFVGRARNLAREYGACVVPGTRVLTDDLRWVPVESLAAGDGLLGLDEEPPSPRGKRRLRRSRVEFVGRRTEPLVRVITDRGAFVASHDHPVLAHSLRGLRGNLSWTAVVELQPGQLVKFLQEPWAEESGDSWLAGFVDGEGSLAFGRGSGRGLDVDITQKSGRELERAKAELGRRGFRYSDYRYSSRQVHNLRIGGQAEGLKFLGAVRPQRLLGNWLDIIRNGSSPALPEGAWATVQAVEGAGEGAVVTLQTSTRTYVAEGFVSHNCIAYIDEIDAVAMSRSGVMGGGGMGMLGGMGGMGMGMNGALTRLLYEMDGIGEPSRWERLAGRIYKLLGRRPPTRNWHVLFMGSTNRPDILDPALLRPGRFDQVIKVDRPDRAGRREIIRGYLSRIRHDPDSVDIEAIVADTPHATPAQLMSAITKDAVRRALFDGREYVNQEDIDQALQEQLVGMANPIEEMDPLQLRSIAYHEAGHAVVQHYVMPDQRIARVSIVRRSSGALGYMLPVDTVEIYGEPLRRIVADIMVALAGHLAVKVFMGEFWTGASSDYSGVRMKFRQLALHGFFGPPVSELFTDVKELRFKDERVEHVWLRLEEQVIRLLESHADEVEALVEALLARGDLSHREVLELLGKNSLQLAQEQGRELESVLEEMGVNPNGLAYQRQRHRQALEAPQPSEASSNPDAASDA
jgi:ATP-dependent Zn protease